MLGWFLPREERFFELFARHAQLAVAGAQSLGEMLKGGDHVFHYCKEIGARELEADEGPDSRSVLQGPHRPVRGTAAVSPLAG